MRRLTSSAPKYQSIRRSLARAAAQPLLARAATQRCGVDFLSPPPCCQSARCLELWVSPALESPIDLRKGSLVRRRRTATTGQTSSQRIRKLRFIWDPLVEGGGPIVDPYQPY